MPPRSPFLAAALFAMLTAGCASVGPHSPEAPPQAAADGAAPQVLERSLYAKDGSGALTEDDLQKILESPIDLQFPARVGVVPLAKPFDPEGPVEIQTRSVAAQSLARALIGHPHFSHVSDISTDLPNVGGLEGLRVIAARYRLRYLVLYSEQFEDDTHLNGWAWLYPTIIGVFVAPGLTVESNGLAQAHLIDVRTGTVLFTVVEPMQVSEPEWVIGAERAHRKAQAAVASDAAKRLAKRVARQTNALVAFADAAATEDHVVTRILPAPIATPKPAVASKDDGPVLEMAPSEAAGSATPRAAKASSSP